MIVKVNSVEAAIIRMALRDYQNGLRLWCINDNLKKLTKDLNALIKKFQPKTIADHITTE